MKTDLIFPKCQKQWEHNIILIIINCCGWFQIGGSFFRLAISKCCLHMLVEVCGWEDKHWLLLFILNISVESLLGRLGHGDQTIVDTHSEILISRQMPSQDLLSDDNTLQWILMSEKEILAPEIEIEYVYGKLRMILCAYPRILWRQLFSNAIAKWHSGTLNSGSGMIVLGLWISICKMMCFLIMKNITFIAVLSAFLSFYGFSTYFVPTLQTLLDIL